MWTINYLINLFVITSIGLITAIISISFGQDVSGKLLKLLNLLLLGTLIWTSAVRAPSMSSGCFDKCFKCMNGQSKESNDERQDDIISIINQVINQVQKWSRNCRWPNDPVGQRSLSSGKSCIIARKCAILIVMIHQIVLKMVAPLNICPSIMVIIMRRNKPFSCTCQIRTFRWIYHHLYQSFSGHDVQCKGHRSKTGHWWLIWSLDPDHCWASDQRPTEYCKRLQLWKHQD